MPIAPRERRAAHVALETARTRPDFCECFCALSIWVFRCRGEK